MGKNPKQNVRKFFAVFCFMGALVYIIMMFNQLPTVDAKPMLIFLAVVFAITGSLLWPKKHRAKKPVSPRPTIQTRELPKHTKSNNCNGCPKQSTCEYGYYTYDPVDKKAWPLWQKFLMLSAKNSFYNTVVSRPEKINEYMTQFTSKKVFNKSDVEWLTEYLEYEKANIQQYSDFGKCGPAYLKYMRYANSVKAISLAIEQAVHRSDKT